MKFLKPTRAKVITAIIILLLWWIIITVRSFFEVSLAPLCLPELMGSELTPTSVPFNLRDTVSDLSTITAYHGYKGCPPYAPSYEFAYSIYSVIQIILPFIATYLLSCIIVFLITKGKKHKKIMR